MCCGQLRVWYGYSHPNVVSQQCFIQPAEDRTRAYRATGQSDNSVCEVAETLQLLELIFLRRRLSCGKWQLSQQTTGTHELLPLGRLQHHAGELSGPWHAVLHLDATSRDLSANNELASIPEDLWRLTALTFL